VLKFSDPVKAVARRPSPAGHAKQGHAEHERLTQYSAIRTNCRLSRTWNGPYYSIEAGPGQQQRERELKGRSPPPALRSPRLSRPAIGRGENDLQEGSAA